MLKQSKTQISLIVTLGLMTLSQIGVGLYKSYHPNVPSQSMLEKNFSYPGAAKAFGLAIPKEKHFQVSSVKELDHVFKNWNYTLTKATSEGKVPRLFLAKLPRDMRHQKKSSNASFIQVLLPHILKVNEQILVDRARLVDMQKRQAAGHRLLHAEKMWPITPSSSMHNRWPLTIILLHRNSHLHPSTAPLPLPLLIKSSDHAIPFLPQYIGI